MSFRRIVAVIGLLAVAVFGTGSAQAGLATIRRQAEQGNARAQLHLGILYEFGRRLADHDTKAVVWYTLAAERGNKEAARRRDLLLPRLTAAERKEAATEVAARDARMHYSPSAAGAASAPAPAPAPKPSGAGGVQPH